MDLWHDGRMSPGFSESQKNRGVVFAKFQAILVGDNIFASLGVLGGTHNLEHVLSLDAWV